MDSNLNFISLDKWGVFSSGKRPLVIAGPCSAETEEQVYLTAKELSLAGVEVFRAGIWKPRTRPNSFEGAGSKGLKWLKQVQTDFNMKVMTEVANGKHVEEVLGMGIDMIWIGARTSSNPFAVQEIADALKGEDIPVWIKNPVNPDPALWLGGLERLCRAGLKKIGAIHRGFFSTGQSKYRNTPNWQLPVDLRCRYPELTVFCDPSHIAGNRKFVYEISQRAMDLGFDGLIIEAHIHPEKAWSDNDQQLTPGDLSDLLSRINIRKKGKEHVSDSEELERWRTEIDIIDDELLELLSRRMDISGKIGNYKKEHKITILQPTRWQNILQKAINKAKEKGLRKEFIELIFGAIHEESIHSQTDDESHSVK